MNLTIDIGNSVIKLALFKNREVVKTFAFETRKSEQYDHYYLTISNLLFHYDRALEVKKAIISSVVPRLTNIISQVVFAIFPVTPLIVGPGIKTGISLKVDNPIEVGADIVSTASGAFYFGEGPFIIVDLGTANKYSYVDRDKVFHGVSISSGLSTSFGALISGTDQLLQIPFYFPKKVLGKNTRDSLASGALYGLIGEITGIVNRIKEEVKTSPLVLLTGGNAEYVKEALKDEYLYVPHLAHYGLLLILEKNHAL